MRTHPAAILVVGISTLLIRSGSAQTITYLDGQPPYNNTTTVTSPNTLNLTLGSGSAEEAGVFSGTGNVVKVGAGTLTLSNAHTYTGTTTVSEGTLRIGGSTGALADSTAVTVTAGATLEFARADTIGSLAGAGTVMGGGNTLLLREDTTTTFSGTLSNIGIRRDPFSPAAIGQLTLTGTTSGNVSLSAEKGAIIVNNADAVYTNGSVDAGPASLQIANGTLTGFVNITGIGSGTPSGGLRVGTGGTTGTLTANVFMSNAGNLTFDRSNDYTYSGAISGGHPNDTVVKNAAGTLTFTQNNSFGGKMVINGGSVQFGNGGTTGMLPANITVFGGGSVIFNRSNDVTFANSINGGNISKLGAGTLTLSNASNTWSSTTITEGSIRLGAANVLPNTPVSIAAAGNLNLNNFSETIGALSGSGSVTLGSGTLTVDSSTSTSFTGNISGTGGFTKAGSGTLTLGGTNTYSGTTTVNGGSLQLSAGSAFPTNSTLAVNTGATFDLNGLTASTASLTGGGSVNLKGGSLSVVINSGVSTFSGVINDSAAGGTGSFTKSGSGTLILPGNQTFSGNTTISGGALQIGNGSAGGELLSSTITNNASLVFNRSGSASVGATISGTGSVTLSGSGTIALGGNNSYGGGTFLNAGRVSIAGSSALGSGTVALNGGGIINSAAVTLSNNVHVDALAGTIDTSGGDLTLSGNVSGSGALSKVGTGTLTLSGTNNVYNGTMTVSAGTVTFNTAMPSGNIVNNAAVTFAQGVNATYTGTMSGAGTLTKTGAGILTVTGNSPSFSGPTTISEGTLALGQASALGTGAVTVATGATLDAGANSFDLGRLLGTGSLKGSGVFSYGAATDLSVTNAITGSTSLSKSGTGTLTLSGNSDYSGGTTLDSGTLIVAANAALGTGGLMLNGGELQASGGPRTLANTVTLNGDTTISGSQSLILEGDFTLARNRDLTVTSAVSAKISGVIGQSGGARALLKYGSGELEVTGANTYTGGTTVAEGTLRLNNTTGSALGTGAVTVESGATLIGAGSFSGALQNNGTFAPGNSPALSTLSNFSQGSTGVLQIELGGITRGIEFDALNVTGSLSLDGTLHVSLYNGFIPVIGQSFDLFNWGSLSGTFDTIVLPALSPGYQWNVSGLYNTGEIAVVAVPEPSVACAGLAIGALLGLRRHRRR